LKCEGTVFGSVHLKRLPEQPRSSCRLRSVRVASIRRASVVALDTGYASDQMEQEIGQLWSARTRVWVHRPRRITAGHLAIHRGDPRARPPSKPQRLSVTAGQGIVTGGRPVELPQGVTGPLSALVTDGIVFGVGVSAHPVFSVVAIVGPQVGPTVPSV
jgi:hypothetical protein